MFGAFGEYAFVAHSQNLGGYLVAVYELGVAKHLGVNAEEDVDFVGEDAHLLGKFLGVSEGGEGAGVGDGQELHAAGVGQLFQEVNHLGHVLLKLLDGDAADGDGAFEGAVALLNHAQKCLCGRDVGALCYAGDDVVVEEIVVVVVVVANVKETVAFQAHGLMNLKV